MHGGIGFVGGYIFGTQVESRVAKFKYLRQQHQNNLDKNKENSDSTDSKKVFNKSES